MQLKQVLAITSIMALSTVGFAVAQQDDDEPGHGRHKPGKMLERIADRLDLNEEQQVKFDDFATALRTQFSNAKSDMKAERKAAKKQRKLEREQDQEKLEAILMNPEFDIQAYKRLRADQRVRREAHAAEMREKWQQMETQIAANQDAILSAYADFHRTLSEEQRQKLVWMSEKKGGFLGFGRHGFGHHARGGDRFR